VTEDLQAQIVSAKVPGKQSTITPSS